MREAVRHVDGTIQISRTLGQDWFGIDEKREDRFRRSRVLARQDLGCRPLKLRTVVHELAHAPQRVKGV